MKHFLNNISRKDTDSLFHFKVYLQFNTKTTFPMLITLDLIVSLWKMLTRNSNSTTNHSSPITNLICQHNQRQNPLIRTLTIHGRHHLTINSNHRITSRKKIPQIRLPSNQINSILRPLITLLNGSSNNNLLIKACLGNPRGAPLLNGITRKEFLMKKCKEMSPQALQRIIQPRGAPKRRSTGL